MQKQITVTFGGKKIKAERGDILSSIINGERPCGGHGRCGKCKAMAKGDISPLSESERKLLSRDEIISGVRLLCLARALGDCEIKSLEENRSDSQILTYGDLPKIEITPSFSCFGVAIDIGTTTLAARLYDNSGKLLSSAARLNPQSDFGYDVISRIEASIAGKLKELAMVIADAIDGMIYDLSATAKINSKDIDYAVITGNTVMLSLLVGESVEPFSHAPFKAERLFGEEIFAKEIGLKALLARTPIYFPPCISAFVGADTVCAILSSELCSRDAAMLVDIGTNGEIALWNGKELRVCSTAAGPAFEGLAAHTIGDCAPHGICGSGLVDAVACMLELDELDESGYLESGEAYIEASVSINQKDIRALQLAKSAICAGIKTLIEEEGITKTEIDAFYIAGGFGNYLNRINAMKIGLLPRELASRAVSVGNAALTGAAVLLLSRGKREEASDIAKRALHLELTTNRKFSELYMSGMLFGFA